MSMCALVVISDEFPCPESPIVKPVMFRLNQGYEDELRLP